MAKKQRITIAAGVLTCEYPSIGKSLVRKLSDYPASIYVPSLAADHGMKQKFGDAASGKEPAVKYAEVVLIDEALMNGQWERTASPVDTTPLVLEAVARIKGGKFENGKLAVKDKKGRLVEVSPTEKQIAEWKDNANVKLEIHKIKEEKLKKAAEEADDIEIEI